MITHPAAFLRDVSIRLTAARLLELAKRRCIATAVGCTRCEPCKRLITTFSFRSRSRRVRSPPPSPATVVAPSPLHCANVACACALLSGAPSSEDIAVVDERPANSAALAITVRNDRTICPQRALCAVFTTLLCVVNLRTASTKAAAFYGTDCYKENGVDDIVFDADCRAAGARASEPQLPTDSPLAAPCAPRCYSV